MSNDYVHVHPVDAEDPPSSQGDLLRNEGATSVESGQSTPLYDIGDSPTGFDKQDVVRISGRCQEI